MILKNPTQNEVAIKILGKDFSVLPGKEIEVSESDGKAWLKVHGFLQVVDADAPEIKTQDKDEVKISDMKHSDVDSEPIVVVETPKKEKVIKSKK